jgi:LysW-gamma-L-lysine carboxypeptidase
LSSTDDSGTNGFPELGAGAHATLRSVLHGRAGPPARSLIDPVELLREAAAIASPSGDERALAEHLVAQMSSLPGSAFIDGSGSAVCRLGSGPLRVTFLGHIDTVPGEIPVRIEEGRLYGRGTVDAKGPLCAAIGAASRLGERTLERMTLTIIGATEEEVPSSRGARHALSAYEAPDLVIVGEPSGWDCITLGYKGRLVLKVEVAKASRHSAGSESSAAEDAVDVWNLARGWADVLNRDRDGLFETMQATLQHIGSVEDGLSETCRAVIGFRLPPWMEPGRAREALESMLPSGPSYTFSGAELPYRGPKDTILTRAFRVAIRQQGGRPRFKLKTGTSDMNVVAPHWRVPMVAYGPGDSALDHTPTEHVEVDELRRASSVLQSVFEEIASPDRSAASLGPPADGPSQSPESS